MAIIRIKNLLLRTIVGINDEERENLQDVVINVELEIDGRQAIESDDIENTLNYRSLTKEIIRHVEHSQYFLLEKLAGEILKIVMSRSHVQWAKVEVDKPHALRFAESVSVEVSETREV